MLSVPIFVSKETFLPGETNKIKRSQNILNNISNVQFRYIFLSVHSETWNLSSLIPNSLLSRFIEVHVFFRFIEHIFFITIFELKHRGRRWEIFLLLFQFVKLHQHILRPPSVRGEFCARKKIKTFKNVTSLRCYTREGY